MRIKLFFSLEDLVFWKPSSHLCRLQICEEDAKGKIEKRVKHCEHHLKAIGYDVCSVFLTKRQFRFAVLLSSVSDICTVIAKAGNVLGRKWDDYLDYWGILSYKEYLLKRLAKWLRKGVCKGRVQTTPGFEYSNCRYVTSLKVHWKK